MRVAHHCAACLGIPCVGFRVWSLALRVWRVGLKVDG